jgi:hypothetical protein
VEVNLDSVRGAKEVSMARPRDFLARFRPVGTPGPAVPAGVPADRVTELSVELGPVLDAFNDTQLETAAVRSAGEAEATRLRHDGGTRAEDLVTAARADAQTARVRTLARAGEAAVTEAARSMDAANVEARAIEARVAQRLPELVKRIELSARADLFDHPFPGTNDGPGRSG